MPQKITDDELLSRVEQELRAAQDYMGGKLSAQRRRALAYYMGQAEGDLAPSEVDGRSSFVSTDVADTVEWMLPSLLRIFTASDRVVSLTPRKPGAEQLSEDATDYLNYVFSAQNDGFLALHTMFKDALISKVSSFNGGGTQMGNLDDKKLIAAIDFYVSDFGTLKVVPNRFQRARTAFVLESEKWAIAYLRPFQTEDLAKTGDSDAKHIIVEYALEARNEAASGAVRDLS